jgi:nicotinate-nucleotide pyrophosphorylase (carboxylating)
LGDFRHLGSVELLSPDEVLRAVRDALAEDIGAGDVTTLATVPHDHTATALMVAREPLVLAGIDFAVTAFRELSTEASIALYKKDGDKVSRGEPLLNVSGSAGAILTAERVALNFVQRLSGVATLTASFVEAVRGTGARILDTRKTTPGWRRFEKYAVACGGGTNHRFGLYDMVLIKDNHLASLRTALPDAIQAAVARSRKSYPKLKIEVEVDTLEQLDSALAAGADIILLDNMTLDQMRHAVEKCRGRARTEASGGVTIEKVRAIAETGVDYISSGALTHSARAMDIALDFQA